MLLKLCESEGGGGAAVSLDTWLGGRNRFGMCGEIVHVVIVAEDPAIRSGVRCFLRVRDRALQVSHYMARDACWRFMSIEFRETWSLHLHVNSIFEEISG